MADAPALAIALKSLAAASGLQIQLAIYAPESQLQAHRAELNIPPIVELRGWKRPEELPALYHKSDILVHVESFDPAITEYTRLSFSTKLSQYMMAGRCILAVGPKEAGSLRMLERAGGGVIINEADPAAIAAAVAPLISHRGRLSLLGRCGRQWAQEWCERASAHQRFREQLVATAARNRDPRRCELRLAS